MSHHLDSEQSRRDSRVDLTAQFVFRGETGTVFVMDVNSSFAGPDAPRGFHPDGRYELKIHIDGSAMEELTYRVIFGPPDQDGEQEVALYALTGPDARDDDAVGELLADGRTHIPISGPAGLRLWAGRAADPFYVDLTQVFAINDAVTNGARLDLAGWRPETARSSYAGHTVHSIVVEVADQDPHLGPGQNIGVWSTTKLPTGRMGEWRQVQREGIPMMWTIFRPDHSEYANAINATHPADDPSREGAHIARLAAGLAAANGTTAEPATHGQAVARRLLPDLLPYRTGTDADFGFVGFNGRNLADNAPEAMFSLVMNAAEPTGLTPAQFADTRSATFPYVVGRPAL